jgi:uncharacterized protein
MLKQNRFVEGAELRASQGDEGALVIDGRAIKYGALSELNVPAPDARERIAPGAFAESLKARNVVADYNHSTEYLPLGNTANRTLELFDTPEALTFTLRLNPKIQAHRDIHELVKAGTMNCCSFAFNCTDDEWVSVQGTSVRTVKKGNLFAITLTPSPAYGNGATVASARSLAYRFAQSPNFKRYLDRVPRSSIVPSMEACMGPPPKGGWANSICRAYDLMAKDRPEFLVDMANRRKAHVLGLQMRSERFKEESRKYFDFLKQILPDVKPEERTAELSDEELFGRIM